MWRTIFVFHLSNRFCECKFNFETYSITKSLYFLTPLSNSSYTYCKFMAPIRNLFFFQLNDMIFFRYTFLSCPHSLAILDSLSSFDFKETSAFASSTFPPLSCLHPAPSLFLILFSFLVSSFLVCEPLLLLEFTHEHRRRRPKSNWRAANKSFPTLSVNVSEISNEALVGCVLICSRSPWMSILVSQFSVSHNASRHRQRVWRIKVQSQTKLSLTSADFCSDSIQLNKLNSSLLFVAFSVSHLSHLGMFFHVEEIFSCEWCIVHTQQQKSATADAVCEKWKSSAEVF